MAETIARFVAEHPEFPVVDFLELSSFDELISIDLEKDTYTFIFNVEQKYTIPDLEGNYSSFYLYVANRLVHPDERSLYLDVMNPDTLPEQLKARNGIVNFEFRAKRPNGEWRWCEQFVISGGKHGVPKGCIYCYVFDIQTRKDREEGKTRVSYPKVEYLDALTSLPREKDFYSAANIILADTKVNWMLVAIDLQHFKLLNEWYGRDLGDRILSGIGQELSETAKMHDGIAAYMGGDDFILLIRADGFRPDELYRRLQIVLSDAGVSIGFLPAVGVCYSNGERGIYTLYDEAMLACQEAKKDYRIRVVFYSDSLIRQTAVDYKVLSDFKKALTNGEITFYLQPQCRAVNGKIVGAEALARWIRTDGTMIPPSVFVQTLEKYGLVPDLDRHIWEEVCIFCKQLIDRGNPVIPISVNISPVDIFTMDVPAYFEGLVKKYGIPKEAIKVEITESAYGEDSDRVRNAVQTFRNMGFMVLMDDFGSGFSSLNMLRELNVDMIKLDAFFMRMDEATMKKGMHIIESVVNMAKTMSMPIIVEGVETTEQSAYLMSLGCRYIQGYYFYKPMPKWSFEELIRDVRNIELQGFTFKFNEEFHIREFLNKDVYSDSMLNQIIGPAAIYAWDGKQVDIVRFNQQFYQAVHDGKFTGRLVNIQQYMPAGEVHKLSDVLQKALDDRLNGSQGVLSFRKVDDTMVRFLIHFYYLGMDGDKKRFYGAARDVTDIVKLQRQMDLLSRFVSRTVLFLTAREDKYVFEVVAHGLENVIGMSGKEIEEKLNAAKTGRQQISDNESALWKIALKSIETQQGMTQHFRMLNKNGSLLNLVVDVDYVKDPFSEVKCILSMRRADSSEEHSEDADKKRIK